MSYSSFYFLGTLVVLVIMSILVFREAKTGGSNLRKRHKDDYIWVEMLWFLMAIPFAAIVAYDEKEYGQWSFFFATILFFLVRFWQYCWYLGPLRPLRQRRIERLRAKWQDELKMWQNWVEALEWIDANTDISPETALKLSVARKQMSLFQKKLALLS